jgi:hypothetical protein
MAVKGKPVCEGRKYKAETEPATRTTQPACCGKERRAHGIILKQEEREGSKEKNTEGKWEVGGGHG